MRLLSKEQIATDFEVSTKTIDRYVKKKWLITVKEGKFIRFPEDQVLAVKESLKKNRNSQLLPK